ncbi:MAG TPA: hypothetical protein VMI12_11155 [Puia sp.]|nr:hypothetical protein [Puia sp.]
MSTKKKAAVKKPAHAPTLVIEEQPIDDFSPITFLQSKLIQLTEYNERMTAAMDRYNSFLSKMEQSVLPELEKII